MKFGCHSSTWVLDYDLEVPMIDQMIKDTSNAGFKGIDVQVALLGDYFSNPNKLNEQLEKNNLELGSITVPFSWNKGIESENEFYRFENYCNFLIENFPKTILNLPVRNGENRENIYEKQKSILNIVNNVGKRAYDKGIQVSFHPASPETSYFRTKEDYDVMFNLLDFSYLSYTPDAGHIHMGGMDAFEIISSAYSFIKHIHIKDCSNEKEWRKMGEGDVDLQRILKFLKDNNYNGWVMFEEETEQAKVAPNLVVGDIYNHLGKIKY